jgi:hypothetical protein
MTAIAAVSSFKFSVSSSKTKTLQNAENYFAKPRN